MPKDDIHTKACGTLDEAVAALGLARAHGPLAPGLSDFVLGVQRELFVAGAEVATAIENASKLTDGVSKVTDEMVINLERQIDEMVATAPLPDYFIVPGSNLVSAALDLARAVVRRAERLIVSMNHDGSLSDDAVLRYVNRLSDALFTASRFEEHHRGTEAPASR